MENELKTERFEMRISATLKQAVERKEAQLGCTTSEYIRWIIEQEVRDEQR